MKKNGKAEWKALVEAARQAGATAAKVIPARMVVVDERVRLKCEVPRCSGYGQYLTCPPHVMAVDAFQRILARYRWCLLVQVEAQGINSTDRSRDRISLALARKKAPAHYPFRLKLLDAVV